MRLTLAICIAATFATRSEAASIVIDERLPVQSVIYYADPGYRFTGQVNGELLAFANPVTTIDSVEWWGGCLSTAQFPDNGSPAVGAGPETCPADNFTLNFFADLGGEPFGPALATHAGPANQTATGNLIGQAGGYITEYHYSATFAPFALGAGNYWLVISNNAVGTAWGWESAGTEDQHLQYNSTIPGWEGLSDTLAFRVSGPDTAPPAAVPEPASMSLLALGLAGMAARRRRRGRELPR